MKKLLILCLLCLSVLSGYAQNSSIICKEVCGVKFGSSYETAKAILKNKFGEPDYFSTDDNCIVYKYKMYGGISFSYISFNFQRDGLKSYMNLCVMGYDCETEEEAKSKRDAIWGKVKEKYRFGHEDIDIDGFKYYESGCSPLGGFSNGFVVDIVKLNETYNGYKYFARIKYGPYNYVKEDF